MYSLVCKYFSENILLGEQQYGFGSLQGERSGGGTTSVYHEVQGDMRRVAAGSRSVTGTNGGDMPSPAQEIFGFNG